jgi:hypothetical protein
MVFGVSNRSSSKKRHHSADGIIIDIPIFFWAICPLEVVCEYVIGSESLNLAIDGQISSPEATMMTWCGILFDEDMDERSFATFSGRFLVGIKTAKSLCIIGHPVE